MAFSKVAKGSSSFSKSAKGSSSFTKSEKDHDTENFIFMDGNNFVFMDGNNFNFDINFGEGWSKVAKGS